MRSMRRQLVLGAGAAATLILLLAGTVLFFLIRHAVVREFDQALRDQASFLQSQVERENGRIRLEMDDETQAWFGHGHRPNYFELWDETGQVLQRSASLGTRDLLPGAAAAQRHDVLPVTLPDRRPGRQLTVRFQPLDDANEKTAGASSRSSTVILTIARDATEIQQVLRQVYWLLVVVIVVTAAACAAILAAVVARGLKPVRRLGDAIGAIETHRLSQCLETGGLPEELRPVADSLNQFLVRLATASLREKTLSADLAHELRTPLYGLRAKLEVTLAQPRQPAAYQKALLDCLEITLATQRMAENLLTLARLDAGPPVLNLEPVRLLEFLHETWQPFAERAAGRQLRFEWEGTETTLVTDREKLRLVLNMLFDNVVSHAASGGKIRLRLHRDQQNLLMELGNSGNCLTAADAAHVFDRFWRGDAARSGGEHCGLGLSLAQRMAQLLHAEITVSTETSGWFAVQVCFQHD